MIIASGRTNPDKGASQAYLNHRDTKADPHQASNPTQVSHRSLIRQSLDLARIPDLWL
jgi:hypothetical protein